MNACTTSIFLLIRVCAEFISSYCLTWKPLFFCLSSSGETLNVAATGWHRSRWCCWALSGTLPATCSCTASSPTMATSSDPGCERLDPNSSVQTGSLTDVMAAMTTKDPDGSAANGVGRSRDQQDGAQAKRTQPSRPNLTGRKLSLQERGTYLSSGSGGGFTHISPRVARRPTVESKRVSISDSQVRCQVCWSGWYKT